jgi:hypothetical protein
MGWGGTSQLTRNDAVTWIRGKCDGRPGGTQYNGPKSLTRRDVMRGPRFTSTGPVQDPRPSPHRISLFQGEFLGFHYHMIYKHPPPN